MKSLREILWRGRGRKRGMRVGSREKERGRGEEESQRERLLISAQICDILRAQKRQRGKRTTWRAAIEEKVRGSPASHPQTPDKTC